MGAAGDATTKLKQLGVTLTFVDMAIIAIYFVLVLGIGFYLKRFAETGEDFFLAGRGMTAWVAGLAFISTNLGSQETIGYSSATYQHGMLMNHAYWIGAIPAIVFLSLVMMPFYHICRTHSVPGYLKLRFGEASRSLSGFSFLFLTLFMSGINMFGLAIVMKVILGWDLNFSIWVASITVALYVAAGGLLSAIFNEVLQFFLIWFGFLMVPVVGLIETGGWDGMKARIAENIAEFRPDITVDAGNYLSMWGSMGDTSANPAGMHWAAIVLGWGLAISFGYWTTDFLVVQRVLSAKNLSSAQNGTIIGGFFKMFVPIIVILPGLLALAVLDEPLLGENDPKVLSGEAYSYNCVLPLLLQRYCGPGLLGLGVTSLIAGFMAGMAGNVSAFATVWTYDIYRPLINRNASDRHYVTMGRVCALLGIFISIGAAYLCQSFATIMALAQLLFVVLIVPLFVPVVLGMLWRRTTAPAAFWGLLCGILACCGMIFFVHWFPGDIQSYSEFFKPEKLAQIKTWDIDTFNPKHLTYITFSPDTKDIPANVWMAVWTFAVSLVVVVGVSLFTKPKPTSELKNLCFGETEIPSQAHLPLLKKPMLWGCVLLGICIVLNIIFW
ncbi:MAG: Na+/galactose cotransporter [Planctomycetes bacterium RBG_13_63_9]|nr:MAG: Na+/galactose cotransporter [Planctomycetes bacterium RBG_13_63_9]